MGGVSSGYGVRLSYHRRDRTEVDGIARALGDRSLRLFLNRWYLTPEQYRTLCNCAAVAVMIGPDGLARWRRRERYLAIASAGLRSDLSRDPALVAKRRTRVPLSPTQHSDRSAGRGGR